VKSRDLIATARIPHLCRRCYHGHRAQELTRGARLRSWAEGWRLGCPVCGSDVEDAWRGAASVRGNAPSWLAERLRVQARKGEALLDQTLGRSESLSLRIIELMRVLLLPRHRRLGYKTSSTAIPRLLNVVVPGFDDDAEKQHPEFRPPGNLLLPISIRAPLLAGVDRVAARPERWIEPLLAAAERPTQRRIWDCLSSLHAEVGAGEGGLRPVATAR
jgi:hypothetical protein